MKSTLCMSIYLLLSVIQYSENVAICSENEEPKSDANCETACTITDLIKLEGLLPKCVCINGFARTDNGTCVKAEKCRCGVNEILLPKKHEKCKECCMCAEGFHRQGVKCVKCENNQQDICLNYDQKHCKCKLCRENWMLCHNKCYNNYKNCYEFDLNECKCLKCNPGYRKCQGICYRDDPECVTYNDICLCEHCSEKYRLCKNSNTCVKKCEEPRKYNEVTCGCDCPVDTEPCRNKCVKTACEANQYFSYESCKCICNGGFFPCQNACHKLFPHCETYDNKSCRCNRCSPGYKLCNNTCISATCGPDKYFSTDKCSCVCSGGFYECKGSCHLVLFHCEHYNKHTCKCDECSPGFSLCKNNCVHSACRKDEIFVEDYCSCKCRPGFRKCNGVCRPILPNCIRYNDKTCKCIKCSPRFYLDEETCISTNCGKNAFFAESILQCVCKKGYIRNDKGICHEITSSSNWFTQIIFGLKGLCRENEFYRSCHTKTEKTCQGTRTIKAKERCFCKKGYIRDERSMLCVKVCPLPGNINETFERLQFGPEKFPPLTNVTTGEDIQKYLENKNEPGYRCINGYYRVKDKCEPIPKK